MESKKHESAKIAKKRGLFLNIGLIVSLALCVTAFEWKFIDKTGIVDLPQFVDVNDTLDVITPTIIPPPPPPVIEPIFIPVPDDQEIKETTPEIFQPEFDESLLIPIIDYPEPEPEPVESTFTIVENPPTPVGGVRAFYNYIANEMKYPRQAQKMGIEGKVFLNFIVDKDGSITTITVTRGIGAGCNEEAVRALKNSPKWNPGKQRGKPVKVQMSIPITFRLK